MKSTQSFALEKVYLKIILSYTNIYQNLEDYVKIYAGEVTED